MGVNLTDFLLSQRYTYNKNISILKIFQELKENS